MKLLQKIPSSCVLILHMAVVLSMNNAVVAYDLDEWQTTSDVTLIFINKTTCESKTVVCSTGSMVYIMDCLVVIYKCFSNHYMDAVYINVVNNNQTIYNGWVFSDSTISCIKHPIYEIMLYKSINLSKYIR